MADQRPDVGIELLEIARLVESGEATATHAARIRAAADLLASGVYPGHPDVSPGLARVAVERRRQAKLGYSAAHDAHTYADGDKLALAGVCYALPLRHHERSDALSFGTAPGSWPFDRGAWRPGQVVDSGDVDHTPVLRDGHRVRELEKAAALIVAALDVELRRGRSGGAA